MALLGRFHSICFSTTLASVHARSCPGCPPVLCRLREWGWCRAALSAGCVWTLGGRWAMEQTAALCPRGASVQAMWESLPPADGAAESCAEECVCACSHEGRAMHVSLPATRPSCESSSRMRVACVGSGARPGVGRAACWSLPAPCSPQRLSFTQSKPYPMCCPPVHAPVHPPCSEPSHSVLGYFPVVRVPVLFKS